MTYDEEPLADNAIAWALARVGDTAYATRCLAFVEDAIERSNSLEVFGGDDAAESARLYAAPGRTTAPPRGALAFYAATGVILDQRREWGHVGLSLGDGRVVHAWDRVRVDAWQAVEELTPAPGWSAPRWLGWAPLGRVLEGSRPRRWDEDPAAAAARMQTERFSRGTDG